RSSWASCRLTVERGRSSAVAPRRIPPARAMPAHPSRSSGARRPRSLAARLELLDLADQLGDRLLPVGDDAVVRDLEDRLVFLLVDGDDRLAALHAGKVLDRAGDR